MITSNFLSDFLAAKICGNVVSSAKAGGVRLHLQNVLFRCHHFLVDEVCGILEGEKLPSNYLLLCAPSTLIVESRVNFFQGGASGLKKRSQAD